MRLLLDPHILIWYLADDSKLPFAIRNLIIEPQHQVFVSVATVWEINTEKERSPISLGSGSQLTCYS